MQRRLNTGVDLGLPLGLALLHTITLARLRRGDFLNSFPYISNDGFDWITEGLALLQFSTDSTPWPVLRGPVFVAITALDQALGGDGFIVIAAYGLSVFAVTWSIGFVGRAYGQPALLRAVLMAASYFCALGYFRLWVLADPICVGLMTLSALPFVDARPMSTRRVATASALAATAGITQTYGLIPFLVLATARSGFRWWSIRRIDKSFVPMVVGPLIAIALVLAAKIVWIYSVPHARTPSNFSLLTLSSAMSGFYANTWAFYLGPFLPAILFGIARTKHFIQDAFRGGLLLTIATFMVMTFFYQWPEARFTYYYLSIITLFCATLSVQRQWVLTTLCAAPILAGLSWVPDNYWTPNLRMARVTPGDSWLIEAWQTSPVDRFELGKRCPTLQDICDAALEPRTRSKYRTRMLKEYRRRNLLEKSDRNQSH